MKYFVQKEWLLSKRYDDGIEGLYSQSCTHGDLHVCAPCTMHFEELQKIYQLVLPNLKILSSKS